MNNIEDDSLKKKIRRKHIFRRIRNVVEIGIFSFLSYNIGSSVGEYAFPKCDDMSKVSTVKENYDILGVDASYINKVSGLNYNNNRIADGKKSYDFLDNLGFTTRLMDPKGDTKYTIVVNTLGFDDAELNIIKDVVDDTNNFFKVVNDNYSFDLSYDMKDYDDKYSILIENKTFENSIIVGRQSDNYAITKYGALLDGGAIYLDLDTISKQTLDTDYEKHLKHELVGHQIFGLADVKMGKDADSLMDYGNTEPFMSKNDYLCAVAKYGVDVKNNANYYLQFVDKYMLAERSREDNAVSNVCNYYVNIKDENVMS